MGGLSGQSSDIILRLVAGAALVLGLAACGDSTVGAGTNPPYASPQPSGVTSVANRSCEKARAGQEPSGVVMAGVELIRQGTDLQRISDDLTGAVPGGNFGVDANLAARNAADVADQLSTSNLCDPLKKQLTAKAKALKDADDALVSTGGGASAAAALQASQSAYKAISDLVQNPPAS